MKKKFFYVSWRMLTRLVVIILQYSWPLQNVGVISDLCTFKNLWLTSWLALCICGFTFVDSVNFGSYSTTVGEGDGTPLQYSCLENPMDGGAWWAAVHGIAKSRTRLSNFTFTFHFHALEKEIATHSSVPAWRIPGTAEPGGLPSVGSHRAGHDWSDLAAGATAVLLLWHYLKKKTTRK